VSDHDLEYFAEQFHQDLEIEASQSGQERMIRDVLVDRMVDDLAVAGEVEDGIACFHQARGIEISGYNVSTDETTLDLFGAVVTQNRPPETVTRAQVETCLRRLRKFLQRAEANSFQGIEEASPVFDMFHRVNQALAQVSRIRLFVLTDGLTTVEQTETENYGDIPVTVHVWDLRRLHRLVSSGRRHEPVNVDITALHAQPLTCLGSQTAAEHRTLLAVVPGAVLQQIYAQYGARLLELNVRSYLQARGKVNQGIRRTILEEPTRFLAYNNGISATASDVDIVEDGSGAPAIAAIRDLQIVNGGQTTASLHHAVVKDKADLSEVNVQMKLTVVDLDRLDEVVPLISRFANSQNRINEADFSANHPVHVELERLSRTVWAPAVAGAQQQTRWFYERARGQYQDAIFHLGSRARQRQFRETHPASQRFSKTDVAKYELTWSKKPHLVSLGAQKCFREFTILVEESGEYTVDRQAFENLVAKALLFRRAERLVSQLRLGGYRANVVTYTLALLSHRKGKRVNLPEIWRNQSLDQQTEDFILEQAPKIYGLLIDAPGGGNVTEWAKKPACWDRIKSI
jgi:AIPR protein